MKYSVSKINTPSTNIALSSILTNFTGIGKYPQDILSRPKTKSKHSKGVGNNHPYAIKCPIAVIKVMPSEYGCMAGYAPGCGYRRDGIVGEANTLSGK